MKILNFCLVLDCSRDPYFVTVGENLETRIIILRPLFKLFYIMIDKDFKDLISDRQKNPSSITIGEDLEIPLNA